MRAGISSHAEWRAEDGSKLRVPPPCTLEREASSDPAEAIAPDKPTPSSSRVWNALTALPRLFFRREYREALSQSGNHVVGEERVGVTEIRRENPRNDVAQSRADLNIPVDNVLQIICYKQL